MVAITPGTGGTPKSPTVEGQLLEVALFIVAGEADEVKNPGGLDYFQVDASADMSLVTVRFSIPVQAESATGGGYVYNAPEYLASPGFASGTGGTITDDSTVGYFKRLVEHAQEIEAPLQPTTDRISGTLNINNKLFTGQVNIPVTTTIQNDGSIQLTATEFL
ncbi:MAG: hypothetical protein F6J87_30475 [Spirulina sp. SIO3F2]|nr:hypothetical protein [Spirulina sp. SIO3F2]